VKKVTPAGVVSIFASGFNSPDALAFDAAGNLYVANSPAREQGDAGGVVSTFALASTNRRLGLRHRRQPHVANGNDGGSVSKVTPAGVSASSSPVKHPTYSLAFDTAGNLYIADGYNAR